MTETSASLRAPSLKTRLIYTSGGLVGGLMIGFALTYGYYLKKELDCWDKAFPAGANVLKITKAEAALAFAGCWQPGMRLHK